MTAEKESTDVDEPAHQQDVAVSGRGLLAGLAGMIATAIFCWPAALSVGAAILVSERRRYRRVAWVGVTLGMVGLLITLVVIVKLVTTPTGGTIRR